MPNTSSLRENGINVKNIAKKAKNVWFFAQKTMEKQKYLHAEIISRSLNGMKRM